MKEALDSWIVWATQDLAASEATRIREEITAHALDTRDGLIADGMNETAAAQHAVQILGSPHEAREKFLRVCLTQSDEQRFRSLLGRSWWTLPYGLLGCAGIGLFLVLGPGTVIGQGKTGFHLFAGLPDLSLFLWTVALLFEPQIKSQLAKRFPKHRVLVLQGFMMLLAVFNVVPALEEVTQPIATYLQGNLKITIGSGLLVLFLTYRWLRAQLPLTVKTLRRAGA